MLHEGTYAVVSTISSKYDPPHSCKVCVLKYSEATDYMKKIYNEDLSWDIDTHGIKNIDTMHESDWTFAKITVTDQFIRRYYLSKCVHDPR